MQYGKPKNVQETQCISECNERIDVLIDRPNIYDSNNENIE